MHYVSIVHELLINIISLLRMLSDMGAALDWVRQLTLDNKWKSMKIRIGPGVYIMICAHPDAAQTVLKSGRPVNNIILYTLQKICQWNKFSSHNYYGKGCNRLRTSNLLTYIFVLYTSEFRTFQAFFVFPWLYIHYVHA